MIFTAENLGIGLSVCAVIGIIFKIYQSYSDPAASMDKQISLLSDQMKSDREGTDRRFKDVQEKFDKMNETIHQHIIGEATRYDTLNSGQVGMGKDIVRITTILEERLPAKK